VEAEEDGGGDHGDEEADDDKCVHEEFIGGPQAGL
jgi:hypothetical protein